jgi:hypothetical protein
MCEELRHLVPELTVRVAFGELGVADLDATVVGFANGDGDVLLATNIGDLSLLRVHFKGHVVASPAAGSLRHCACFWPSTSMSSVN